MAVVDAPRAAHTATLTVLDHTLVYVSGKGGAGKTTVAATLQIAAVRLGLQAIVCEVGGSHQIPGSVAIEPGAALSEWIRRQPGGRLAAPVLSRSRAFRPFVEAAPGAKELVTVGKFIDLAQSGESDIVIVDAPSTGHALGMLSAARTVSQIASHGPIAAQARELHEYLADAERTAYVGVTLAEEMSLHELMELDAGLRHAIGRGLDLVVVNGVFPDRLTADEAQRLRGAAPRSSPVRAALSMHRQAQLHARRTDWLRERVAAPVVTLPFVFATEIGRSELEQLAERCMS
ncbi:MAG TPA: ArsA-related P-loop ATPase [Solirubrobacteraceae bacterium]|nr:ArsA-related P-loop ATPase [Solirubrobacteraceae bacterium]